MQQIPLNTFDCDKCDMSLLLVTDFVMSSVQESEKRWQALRMYGHICLCAAAFVFLGKR